MSKGTDDSSDRMVVVSVRFPENLLKTIAAYAAVVGKTSQEVIRAGVDYEVSRIVETPEFHGAVMAHILNACQTAATAFGGELPAGLSEVEELLKNLVVTAEVE